MQVEGHFQEEGMIVPPSPHGMIAPNSNTILVHYSFDMVQKVHYSNNYPNAACAHSTLGRPPSLRCAVKAGNLHY